MKIKVEDMVFRSRSLEAELSDYEDTALLKRVDEYIALNNKVGAIKLVRMKTGKGLKDAKDFVDARSAAIPYPLSSLPQTHSILRVITVP